MKATKNGKKNGVAKKKATKEESSDEESEPEDKKRNKKLNEKAKKKAVKESSSEDEEESDDEEDSSSEDEKAKKKAAANKRQRLNSNDSSNGKVKARLLKTRKRSESQMSDYVPPIKDPKSEAAKLGIDFKFQRINENKYKQTLTHVTADNSFESKARFGMGGGDKFGEWSNSKLADKVGKGFTKEKNKMKNRNFHAQGQSIGYGVNSVKFD